ncbi:nucleotide exchange factor GrpE [Derxia lacustris]|uniref:nucleotide exchange factor GrpE n=1 Tax=Derxia lacustris TaxID=764842 RepID=UPI000A173950|nr:nucleotide exchange factor GrpE [Derxia lacustris]
MPELDPTSAAPSAEAPNRTESDTPASTALDSEIDQLRRDLEAAQAKAAEQTELFLRARADAENIRRRAQDDVAKAHKFGIESFAESLLAVADSLEAALAVQNATVDSYREGVNITLRQLTQAFEKNKLFAINPVGEKFDPHKHQAIAVVPAEQEPNTVVSVMQKGYSIADRVLRPALVSVTAPK